VKDPESLTSSHNTGDQETMSSPPAQTEGHCERGLLFRSSALFYYIYSNRMSSFTSSTCWGAIKKHQPL